MNERFQVRVPGKWVLTGEHSVLRGGTAVALPHPELGLKLTFEPGPDFRVEPESATRVIRDLLLAIQDDPETPQLDSLILEGTLRIESSVPIGAGLGSSAALCVAMTRWLAEPFGLPEDRLLEFSTRLEHRFHGRSSGMDIAVISTGKPISFVMGRGPTPLQIQRLPRFTFHDTGLRCRTHECVMQVEAFREEKPALSLQVDEAMGAASRLAIEGLTLYNAGKASQGLDLIARAMKQGQECFETWNLMPSDGRPLAQDLLDRGALAVKLTGAGGGGMLVALWAE